MTFVSTLWTGHASDKMITKHCGLTDLPAKGDIVMADRGFDVQEVYAEANVTLNIPPTLPSSCTQFTLKDVAKTQQIASVRILVHCAIGCIKAFHILDGTMPVTLAPVADHLVPTCAFLTNFLPAFVQKESFCHMLQPTHQSSSCFLYEKKKPGIYP